MSFDAGGLRLEVLCTGFRSSWTTFYTCSCQLCIGLCEGKVFGLLFRQPPGRHRHLTHFVHSSETFPFRVDFANLTVPSASRNLKFSPFFQHQNLL